jgi:hypothetical protein
MPLDKPHPRARRCGIEFEEERAWIGFYRRVGRDAAIAAEVMAQLEADADMKRTHLALYLCCKESLRVHKARQARHKRIGQFVRHLAQAIFVRPLLGLRTRLRPWRRPRRRVPARYQQGTRCATGSPAGSGCGVRQGAGRLRTRHCTA